MRAALLLLVLANALFFGWAHWIDVPLPGAHLGASLATVPLTAHPTAAAGDAAATPLIARCASLGPLNDAAGAAAVKTALQARNLQPRDRRVEVPVPDGYWVHIDKLFDATQRGRALRRLARAGVNDAAALAEYGQVSVGLFSEKSGADKRAAAVRLAGFEPAIEERTRMTHQYWLDMDLAGDVPLPTITPLIAGLNIASVPQWGTCPAAAP